MNSKYKNKICCLLLLFVMTTYCSKVFSQGIRKDYLEMTDDERDALVDAYWALGGSNGTNGLNFDIASFHQTNFNDIHFNTQNFDVFFAWHRQASHELERAMKDNAGNEWITTAFWDWTVSNSKSDPLWGSDWLGPFNSAWNLNRNATSSQTLPTQSDIDNALLEDAFFPFSRFEVEGDQLHTRGHTWTGGVMASGLSPKDPVFFFHHNMIDKIWAEWYEIYGVVGGNYYVMTDMPRYPNVDPDDIADPRSLGIFYADNQLAVLDKYTVSNTDTPSEKFGYQYTIQAEDNFIVPSGKDAEMRSCNLIQLLPGFTATTGSTFLAKIDTDCDFTTAALADNNDKTGTQKPEARRESKELTFNNEISSFPNPFSSETNIEYSLESDSRVSMQISNVTGQIVRTLVDNKMTSKGEHNIIFTAEDLPDGIYYCSLINGTTVKTIKLILNN